MGMDQGVTVISRGFDRNIRRTWKASLVRRVPPLIELVGEFDRDVEHPDLGFIKHGTLSYEYYWLDRWYNVFRFHEPASELRNYYCNISMPPKFENGVLDYVDLDIDVIVDRGFSATVLDVEEFEENVRSFSLPDPVRDKAKQTLDQLLTIIDRREFPFDRA